LGLIEVQDIRVSRDVEQAGGHRSGTLRGKVLAGEKFQEHLYMGDVSGTVCSYNRGQTGRENLKTM
jgi:hypothetical protein